MKRMMLLLCLAALIVPATAQHFKQVTGFTGSMASVAAGRSEVWGVNTSGQVFRLTGTKFVSVPGTLSQIAVGGGTVTQKDEIWGLDSSGSVFHFNYGKKSFTQLPGFLSQIAVGEGDIDSCHPYEVWGINSNQNIFRYNYCSKQFDSIPGFLTQISTAGGAVWGINSSAELFAFNFSNQTFQDTKIGTAVFLAADVNGVWALGTNEGIFWVGAFAGQFAFSKFPGTLQQIAAGGDGVWGINSSQSIFRLDPSSGTFVNVSGFLTQIAVGSGAGVWGVAPNSGEVFTFVRP